MRMGGIDIYIIIMVIVLGVKLFVWPYYRNRQKKKEQNARTDARTKE